MYYYLYLPTSTCQLGQHIHYSGLLCWTVDMALWSMWCSIPYAVIFACRYLVWWMVLWGSYSTWICICMLFCCLANLISGDMMLLYSCSLQCVHLYQLNCLLYIIFALSKFSTTTHCLACILDSPRVMLIITILCYYMLHITIPKGCGRSLGIINKC